MEHFYVLLNNKIFFMIRIRLKYETDLIY